MARKLVIGMKRALRSGINQISRIVHPISRLLVRNKVRILCYHRVCDLPPTGDIMDSLNINPVIFDQQMALLSRNKFNVITLEQFMVYKDRNTEPTPKTIIITFDDGFRDNYLVAFPILEKYSFIGTFFPVTEYIDSDRIFQWLKLGEKSLAHCQANKHYWQPLTRDDILEMQARGACFGSHSKSHPYLTKLNPSEVMEELTASRRRLEEILQKPVVCFSYPQSDVNDNVKNMVKTAGYRAALIIKGGSNTLKSDFFSLRRVSVASQDSPAAFMRRVEGAYDWVWWFSPIAGIIQRVKDRERRQP